MPENTNPFTRITEKVADRLLKLEQEAQKSTPIPFDQVKVSAKTMRERVKGNPDMLMKMLADPDQAERVRAELLKEAGE